MCIFSMAAFIAMWFCFYNPILLVQCSNTKYYYTEVPRNFSEYSGYKRAVVKSLVFKVQKITLKIVIENFPTATKLYSPWIYTLIAPSFYTYSGYVIQFSTVTYVLAIQTNISKCLYLKHPSLLYLHLKYRIIG